MTYDDANIYNQASEVLGKCFGYRDEYENERTLKVYRIFSLTPLTYICKDTKDKNFEQWFTDEEVREYLGL
jgi:hypothetical protein